MELSIASDFSDTLRSTAENFIFSLPIFLVLLAGLVLTLVNRRKAPRAALFALVGTAIFLFEFLISLSFPILMLPIRKIAPETIGWIYFGLRIFLSLTPATGFACLILAIWSGRQTTSNEHAKTF